MRPSADRPAPPDLADGLNVTLSASSTSQAKKGMPDTGRGPWGRSA